MNDEAWMREALTLAQKAAEQGEVPIGAVVVDANQQVIGKAYNRTIQNVDPTAHAEILALREAAQLVDNYRLLDATLYCTLEPCAMCAGAIIQARLARVVFGAYDTRAGALCSVFHLLTHPSLNHRAEVCGGILREEAAQLMQEFFKQRR